MASDRSILDSFEEAAEAARRELVADWLDVVGVAKLLDIIPAKVTDMRRAGLLHAVWMVSQERFLFPRWQFDASGKLIPEVAGVLRLMRSPSGFDIRQPSDGWSETGWFYTGHALLDAAQPADLMVSDPARVLAAAIYEFSSAQG